MKSRKMRARMAVPSSAFTGATACGFPREVERTYYPDNTPVAVSQHGNAASFHGAARVELPPGTNLQKELEIELAATGSHVRITQRIRNDDTHSTSACTVVAHDDAGRRALDPAAFSPDCDG